jgi:N-acetylglucosaminyldiphosphoundecaprenol N-acetyl-beta-D-mannosaminyltransferase
MEGHIATTAGAVVFAQDGSSRRLLAPTRRTVLLDAPIDAVTLMEAVSAIDERIAAGEAAQHMSLNAAKLLKREQDEVLREAIDHCELVTADGQAVVWAGNALGVHLPERVTGIDLMTALLELANRRGYRIFLLGAREEVSLAAVAAIRSRHPEIRIAGRHHGYFPDEEERSVVSQIVTAKPEILFVALETPAKELFLARNRDQLQIPFVMGVGGALDVLAGVRRRAPRVLQRAGLEWLFRLAQDPRRLARRYVVGNAQFIWLVLRARYEKDRQR